MISIDTLRDRPPPPPLTPPLLLLLLLFTAEAKAEAEGAEGEVSEAAEDGGTSE